MRILFILPEFVTEPHAGGLARYFDYASQWLFAQGHEVHVLVRSSRDQIVDRRGVRVHQMKAGQSLIYRVLCFVFFHKLDGVFAWLDFSFRAWRWAEKEHGKNAFDLIQSSNFHACGLLSFLFLQIPHVVRVSSFRPAWDAAIQLPETLDRKCARWIEMFYLRHAKYIYAPSQQVAGMLEKQWGVPRVSVMPSPAVPLEAGSLDDSVYLSQLKGKSYLLYFGRLQLHKGVHVLGEALSAILRECPDLYAVFAGSDASSPLGPSMREFIRSKNCDSGNRILFLDSLPYSQLYPVIQGARLIVLPSLVDNLPNTLLEALSAGQAVIGTQGSSFEEVIEHGKDGWLVPPGDAEALSRQVVEVWHSKDLSQVRRNALEKSRRFYPDKVFQTLLKYYQEILKMDGRK